MTPRSWLALCAGVSFAAACGDNQVKPDSAVRIDAALDDGPADAPIDGNPLEPDTLAGTGLCLDDACTQFSPDVHEYAPQYVLWADTATKRRWIFIPPGKKIDTTDMNHWVFPAGTKIWKEFTRDGIRIETRYIVKLVDDVEDPAAVATPWFYVSYQWNSSASDPLGNATTAVTQGVSNANGTNHDIPSRVQCKGCHERVKPGRVLGFSAMSLDFQQADTSLLDLDGLIAADLLTTPPAGATSPHFPLPADASAQDLAALGYMHANCGHCHNPSSDIFTNQTSIDLRLDVTKLATRSATGLVATVGKSGGVLTDNTDGNCNTIADPTGAPGCTQIVVPSWATATTYKTGDRVVKGGKAYICKRDAMDGVHTCGLSATGPSGTGTDIADGTAVWNFAGAPGTRSILQYRYETTNIGRHMPVSGSEMMDPDGDAIIQAWITSLP